mmetsp:Transcript_2668/g.9593  ORF Transcript_2668/g.9593 Transcript_2668/m.9593 type:complete len:95 (+) Transcript_2668:177-461(+)
MSMLLVQQSTQSNKTFFHVSQNRIHANDHIFLRNVVEKSIRLDAAVVVTGAITQNRLIRRWRNKRVMSKNVFVTIGSHFKILSAELSNWHPMIS